MNQRTPDKIRLKVKLDFNLSPNSEAGDFKITDIFDKDQLQSIQDAFALSHNITSIITNVEGKPVTHPSNFSPICSLIRNTKTGKVMCELSDKNIGEMVRKSLKPYSAKCLSCGFIETGAPIIVAGKHIANWMIGQGLNRGIDEKYMIETSLKFGIEQSIFLDAYKNTHFVKLDQFNKIINFLWILARDISSLGYNNVILARDVEERKKTEEELIRSKNKAEESDHLKTAFLANISHEIRTPMNGILGLANLLSDEDLSTDQRKEYIEIINQNSTLLLKLFDDILDIAKMEANQMVLDEKPCYMDQFLQDLYPQFKFQIDQQKSKDLQLILKLPENKIDSLIYADSIRLKQILSNLFTNALKFTQSGFIEFGYVTELPFHLKFYVKDTGIGLPPEKRLIIFDRFRQADESTSKKYGGTGLGLAISKNLVKLMKGDIWVESEVGNGATFYFTIPYKHFNDFEITQQSINKRSELFGVFSEKQILIVENEQLNFHMMYEIFLNTNAKIIHAQNGREAIEICLNNRYINLVFMNIKMPDIDGYQATRAIKTNYPFLPVIAITDSMSPFEKARCFEAGCNDYITKPISNDKILNLARTYLFKIEVRE